jgi:hypothetical protein
MNFNLEANNAILNINSKLKLLVSEKFRLN